LPARAPRPAARSAVSISPRPVRPGDGGRPGRPPSRERRRRPAHPQEINDVQYLLLIYHSENDFAAMSEDEKGTMHKDYFGFTNAIRESGHYLGGNPLQPVATATTVRVRDGKTLTTDGPFAETREQLGGYYLVEARDLDEAIGLAARIPGARRGSIEVRPIQTLG
jgi:hypothetical protein